MNKLLNTISYLTLITAFVMLCIFFFWSFYPYRTIEWKTDKFPVKTKVIKRGDSLIFVSDYCKYVELSAVVSRSFVNDFSYTTTPVTTYAKKGCNKMKVVVTIPKELPAGRYYIHNKFSYKVNPIRTITLVHDSEEFIVE